MTAISELTAGYIDWLFEKSPTGATFHGADGHDDALPDLSERGIRAQEADEDRWLERFAALSDDELDTSERIDRDLVLSSLRGSAITRDLDRWRRDPDP